MHPRLLTGRLLQAAPLLWTFSQAMLMAMQRPSCKPVRDAAVTAFAGLLRQSSVAFSEQTLSWTHKTSFAYWQAARKARLLHQLHASQLMWTLS